MGYIFTLLSGVLYLIIIKPQMKTRKMFALLCISLAADAQTLVLLWTIPCSWWALLIVKPKASLWSCIDWQDIKRVFISSQSHPMQCWGQALSSEFCREGIAPSYLDSWVCCLGFFLCQTTVRTANKMFLSIELQHVLMQFYLPNPTSETRGD